MHRFARAAGLTLGPALLLLLGAACSSEPASVPAPVPAAEAPQDPSLDPRPTSNITVSNAVPTLEELKDLGLSERAAECFIATIDPDDTGRVTDADLFLEAWVACL